MARNWNKDDIDWRWLEAMARRGWGRVAGSVNTDGLGGNFRIGRMLAAGDVRLVALYLIEQQPRHGYDLIKAVEERSGGFYSPSPGIVYPALTYLEEAGFVTSAPEGNKKLYTITDAGRSHLADNREAIDSTLSFLAKAGEQMKRFGEFAKADWPFGGEGQRGPRGNGPERGHRHEHRRGWGAAPDEARPAPHDDSDRPIKDVVPELDDARSRLKAAIKRSKHGSPEQQRQVATILARAARDIEALGEDDVDL